MLVSTNVHFLEEDYLIDNKPRSKIVFYELRAEGDIGPIPETQVSPPLVASTQDQGEPRRSGRVVRQAEHFIGLGEVPEEPKTDPNKYNEAI